MVATFRLYEELNDFLPPERRKVAFDVPLRAGDTVQACLGRLGVPPEAVDLVLVDGASAGMDHPVRNSARVAVYPVFESFDVSSATCLPGRPLRRLAFAVVPELASLAAELRSRGLEVEVLADGGGSLVRAASRGLVLLTRASPRGTPADLVRVYRVRASDPAAQAAEVFRGFQLGPARAPAGPARP